MRQALTEAEEAAAKLAKQERDAEAKARREEFHRVAEAKKAAERARAKQIKKEMAEETRRAANAGAAREKVKGCAKSQSPFASPCVSEPILTHSCHRPVRAHMSPGRRDMRRR